MTWLKNALKNFNVGTVVNRRPKKDLVIALPYLIKMFLQIRTRINRIMQNKLHTIIFGLFSRLRAKLVSNIFQCKDKIPSFVCSGIAANFSEVAAMLPVVAKINVTLRSKCMSTWESRHLL